MKSDDIIGANVRKFWSYIGETCECVAFFEQKYEYEDKWEKIRCAASPYETTDGLYVLFDYDFCEGQTDVRSIIIVALEDILDFYETHGGLKNGNR